MMEHVLALLYITFSVLLLPYGYNCFLMVYGARKYRAKAVEPVRNHAVVTVQLPIYNERFVVKRLLRAVCDLNWPKDRMEVQILDDSTDETSSIIDSEIERLSSKGFDIKAIRRKARGGFKAGALQNALKYARGKYIAILDADFIPPPDFLEKAIPHLEDDQRLGFVQARLGHTNRDFNKLTETIALAIDGHFLVEQPGRDALSMIINFNGSGGILRKEAIEDVGGWDMDVLTEDLEMSYRMRLRGWGSKYLRDVVVPGEVPVNISVFKNQQARWSAGGAQCARKLIRDVWRSTNLSLKEKLESTIHLTNYFIYPFMFLTLVSMVVLLIYDRMPRMIFYSPFGVFLSIGAFGASLMYVASVLLQNMGLKRNVPYLSLLAIVGVGLSAQCFISILRGLFSKRREFVITPKYNINGKEATLSSKIYKPIRTFPLTETIMAAYSLFGIYLAIANQIFTVIMSLSVYFSGFFLIVYYTLIHPRVVGLTIK